MIVISTRASLKTRDRQNRVILAVKNPHNGPPRATCRNPTTISPPEIDNEGKSVCVYNFLPINSYKVYKLQHIVIYISVLMNSEINTN